MSKCCGDAHLLNAKRLAASFAVTARDNGLKEGAGYAAARRCASSYRTEKAKAAMTTSCDQVDGEYRIRPDHPVIVRFPIERNPGMLSELRSAVAPYHETLPAGRREVLRRYYAGDVARKVVGVGTVGTEAFVLLLMGDRDDEPLFLQVKEAQESVLAPLAGPSEYDHQGERAEQNEKDSDYQALVGAVATGPVQAVTGLLTANPRPRLTGPLLPRARPGPGHGESA